MKTCDEMVNSLLERRERYAAGQKRKRLIITCTVTPMCCICLVALMGFGMWQAGMFHTTPSGKTAENALYPGRKDNFVESQLEFQEQEVCRLEKENSAANNKIVVHQPDNPAVNNKIIIRQIEGVSVGRYDYNICLLGDDFVAMDKAELKEYYGINIFPTVPDDIKEWEGQHGIYRRNGGTGEVYWDGKVFNYSNEDFSRTVNIEIKKDSLPLYHYVLLEEADEKSVINNVEVVIAHSDTGYYYTQFMYHNVGFQIIAGGLSQDEFVAVIESLIQ